MSILETETELRQVAEKNLADLITFLEGGQPETYNLHIKVKAEQIRASFQPPDAPDHPDLQNVRDMAKNLRDAFSKDVKQLEIRTRGLVITDALAATKSARNAQEMVLAINQVHRACGAPGNYGYGTPIGDALCALYNGNNLLCD